MPDIVKFYLGEEPILKKRANLALAARQRIWLTCSTISPTWSVKEVHGSGGYGMLIGPAATKAHH